MIGLHLSLSFASPAVKTSRCPSTFLLSSPSPRSLAASDLKPRSLGRCSRRNGVQCSSGSATPGPGENESKAVLDAFFLGKALAEALNERIESTVGEILSVVGQWQAEQQKQVQDFEEEVIQRAKKAKERAALEVVDERDVFSTSLKGSSSTTTTTISTPSPGPVIDDPFQEALRD
ncbi:uncharacterized protein [Typha angustifolia]|uniref:uncharacterized protein isoform X2 n=1 Tax=Typha angustifolia TaxID=59011 RepID=UPI003C30B2EF